MVNGGLNNLSPTLPADQHVRIIAQVSQPSVHKHTYTHCSCPKLNKSMSEMPSELIPKHWAIVERSHLRRYALKSYLKGSVGGLKGVSLIFI